MSAEFQNVEIAGLTGWFVSRNRNSFNTRLALLNKCLRSIGNIVRMCPVRDGLVNRRAESLVVSIGFGLESCEPTACG